MNTNQRLQQTINDMVNDRRGILAADESEPTIKKRFATINLESTRPPSRVRQLHFSVLGFLRTE